MELPNLGFARALRQNMAATELANRCCCLVQLAVSKQVR